MKASTTALVAVALVLSFPLAAFANDFDDDDRSAWEAEFTWLSDRGAMDGCGPARACPQRAITRLEAAKMTALVGVSAGSWTLNGQADPGFLDLSGSWGGEGSAYVEALVAAGAVAGCAVDRFCPARLLTRGEAASLLVGAFDLTAPQTWGSPYTDTAGAFYTEAARISSSHDLWPLRVDTFRGSNPLTRAEFATALVRAAGGHLCTANPFAAGRVTPLMQDHPVQRFTAYAWDETTGCHYSLHPDARQSTASVFKVMVMAGTLYEAQEAGRDPSGWEMSQLEPMITQSANAPVRALWSSFGSAPWFAEQATRFGLVETVTVGDHQAGWGATRTSAADQVQLLRQVVLGHGGLLSPVHRRWALDLMSSVVPDQRWGVGTDPPEGSVVFQKNGFAGVTANSVGVVRRDDGTHYVMAILTTGWPHWSAGIPAVDRVAGWVHDSLG